MRYFNAGSLLFVLLTEKAQVLANVHVTTFRLKWVEPSQLP